MIIRQMALVFPSIFHRHFLFLCIVYNYVTGSLYAFSASSTALSHVLDAYEPLMKHRS